MPARALAERLARRWYERRLALPLWPLIPVSWLFAAIAGLRRGLYRRGVLPVQRLPVPVIVVGNLTAGGSGKTPLVLWLVAQLRAAGWQPGIVSRGYGGSADGARAVAADSPPSLHGDEPLLLARRSGVPVFVGRQRVAAGEALLAAHPECDVLVADDGLQHYRLSRQVELVVFDGRGAGNGWLLPAGPLREPLRRLTGVTALVWNGCPDPAALAAAGACPQFAMQLHGQRFFPVGTAASAPAASCDAAALRGRKLYALAGIGDPTRFFAQLTAMDLSCELHPFPDHHPYSAADLAFARDGVLLMTEKDAVKCAAIVTGEAWFLPVAAVISGAPGGAGLFETILEKLNGRTPA